MEQLDSRFPAYGLVRVNHFLRKHPPWAGAYLYQAYLLRDFRRFAEMRRALRTAEAILGEPHEILKEAVGQAYYDAERHGLAQKYFLQSLSLERRNPSARTWLGRSCLRQGKLEEAKKWLRSALSQSGVDEAEVAFELGKVFRAQEQWAVARRWFEKAARDGQSALRDLLEAREVGGWSEDELRCHEGGPVTMLAAGRRFEKIRPDEPVAYSDQAMALAELNRLPEALAQVARWQRKVPAGHPQASRLRPRVLDVAGRLETSAQLWLQVATDSTDTVPWIYAGSCLARLGHLERAEQCHRRAVQCSGDPDEGMYNLALVLRAQGRYSEALDCARRSFEMDKTWDPDLIYDLEEALRGP